MNIISIFFLIKFFFIKRVFILGFYKINYFCCNYCSSSKVQNPKCIFLNFPFEFFNIHITHLALDSTINMTLKWYQKNKSNKIIVFIKFWQSLCNQKREGPKTHITLPAFNEPRRPCSPDLLHTVQTFDLTQHTNCLLILADKHHKIKDVQVSCIPHNNIAGFTVSISCLAYSH